MTKLIDIMNVTRNLTGQEIVYRFPQLNDAKVIDVFDITHELGQSTVLHVDFLVNPYDIQFQTDDMQFKFPGIPGLKLRPQEIYANVKLKLTKDELESLEQSDLFK